MTLLIFKESDIKELASKSRELIYANGDQSLSFIDLKDDGKDFIAWPIAIVSDDYLEKKKHWWKK